MIPQGFCSKENGSIQSHEFYVQPSACLQVLCTVKWPFRAENVLCRVERNGEREEREEEKLREKGREREREGRNWGEREREMERGLKVDLFV